MKVECYKQLTFHPDYNPIKTDIIILFKKEKTDFERL